MPLPLALVGLAGLLGLTAGDDVIDTQRRLLAGESPSDIRRSSGTLYTRRGPKTPIMERLKAEMARQKANRQNSLQQSGDGTNEILARLEALQDPSRFQPDMAAMQSQARSMADVQFNPIIASLRNQASSAQTRAERNKGELGRMYGSLSSDISSRIPVVQEQYAGTKQSTDQQYQNLQKSITDQYAQSQKEQEDLYKRLGIEAAAPETLGEQQRDRDYFTALAQKEGQTAQTALGMEERGATEFTRRGSDIAQFEGTNRQADLMSALQELMQQYDAEIGSQEAAREAAYMANLTGLQNDFASSSQKRAQQEFENYLASIRLGRELRKDDVAGGQAVSSPADVANRALGLGFTPYDAQGIQDVFNEAVGGDEFILGGLNVQSGTPATKEALAARVVEMGRQQGMNSRQLNALQTIALEYFGRQ